MSGRERRRGDLLRDLLPYGLVTAIQRRRSEREREQLLRDRRTRLDAAAARAEGAPSDVRAWDYETAIALLVERGLAEQEVRDGSMPAASLERCATAVREHLPTDRPLVGLHVGNFVGVSLASTAALLRDRHPDSVVVAIDPDISHRGIVRPASYVLWLLRRFGLQDRVLVATGYSLEATLGNDGIGSWDDDASPWEDLADGLASEQALPRLATVAGGRLDLALLDGNHDAEYLGRELDVVADLLRPGGLLVLDDVDPDAWADIADTFSALFDGADGRFERIDADGRVGVARRV
ncbi:MAG: class I SAM-dependent methyltransferase [Solirubrobacteraceae bacterium]|nr:class I SAM-dependent methyltransferase [Solirubrobacteraceae bacterium]